jgi:hypothetical protein
MIYNLIRKVGYLIAYLSYRNKKVVLAYSL